MPNGEQRSVFENLHLDVDHYNICKYNQHVSGDSFISSRVKGENRTVTVLADGLGSGVKASVLSTLTTTMACKFASSEMDITKAAESILQTLPVCKVRKIAYSTFIIIDMHQDGITNIIEYSAPECIIVRANKVISLSKETIKIESPVAQESTILYSTFIAEPGDRLVFFSDGVVQAGIGSKGCPRGWGALAVQQYLTALTKKSSKISAGDMSSSVVKQAHAKDEYKAKDDITCGVIYYRHPRRLLLVSGPPYDKERDAYIAQRLGAHDGERIICGGTTAQIVARELGCEVEHGVGGEGGGGVDEVPPVSIISGISMVTEGNVTLSKIASILQKEDIHNLKKHSRTVCSLLELLLNTDRIEFIVGTRFNEAHLDPKFMQPFDMRKNIIRDISAVLEKKYFKKVRIEYV